MAMEITSKSGLADAMVLVCITPPLGDIEPACARLELIGGQVVHIDRHQLEQIISQMDAKHA